MTTPTHDSELPDDDFQRRYVRSLAEIRHVGWYPVVIQVGPERRRSVPFCMWWSGTSWRTHPGPEAPHLDRSDCDVAVVGPRIDLAEVW